MLYSVLLLNMYILLVKLVYCITVADCIYSSHYYYYY